LVWIRYYLKIHPMQHKLLLSKTFSTCQQMYKICSRIHLKHRTKLRGCFLHHKVLEWVTHLKLLLHFIVLASKIEAICDRQLSRRRKDLRILIIHYSLSNIIKILSRDNLPIKDHQSMSDLELFNNCSCKMQIWNKLTSQSQQLVIAFQENKIVSKIWITVVDSLVKTRRLFTLLIIIRHMWLEDLMEVIHSCLNKWKCTNIQKLAAGSTRVHSHLKYLVVNQGMLLVTLKMPVLNQVQTASCQMHKCLPSPNYQSAWSSKRNLLQLQTARQMINGSVLNSSHVVIAWLSRISSTIPLVLWLNDHSFSTTIHTLIAHRNVSRLARAHRNVSKLARNTIIIGQKNLRATDRLANGKIISHLVSMRSACHKELMHIPCQFHQHTSNEFKCQKLVILFHRQ
jgi:hypothetical protein